jgi:hypothetical protein
MSITAALNGNITITDGETGTVAYTKTLTGLAVTGTAFGEVSYATVGTSPVSITLPISPVNFLSVKNTHATQNLTVTWTPNGGSSNTVLTLQPGSGIQFQEATAGGGITALSLTGSAAATTAEYLLAG